MTSVGLIIMQKCITYTKIHINSYLSHVAQNLSIKLKHTSWAGYNYYLKFLTSNHCLSLA